MLIEYVPYQPVDQYQKKSTNLDSKSLIFSSFSSLLRSSFLNCDMVPSSLQSNCTIDC